MKEKLLKIKINKSYLRIRKMKSYRKISEILSLRLNQKSNLETILLNLKNQRIMITINNNIKVLMMRNANS